MSLLSLPCNHLVVNQSLQLQLFVMMMLGQIFIHARAFWGRQQSAFFDIRDFHPNAPRYHHTRIALYFEDMNLRKKENMETVFILLSLPLLHH